MERCTVQVRTCGRTNSERACFDRRVRGLQSWSREHEKPKQEGVVVTVRRLGRPASLVWVAMLLLTACELPTVPSAELPATADMRPPLSTKLSEFDSVFFPNWERLLDNARRSIDGIRHRARLNFENAERLFDNAMTELREAGAFVETRAESVAPAEPSPATSSGLVTFACRVEIGGSQEELLRFIDCLRIGQGQPECGASWFATRHVGAHGIARIRIDVLLHCAE